VALRVAFLGLPLAALLLAGDGHDIVYAGICRKGALGTRRLRRVLPTGRVVVKPNLASQAAKIRACSPDLVVSWFWTSRIPAEVRLAGRLGAFGVHPSLLPRHRGGDPYFAVIDAGETVTGVTAHVLEEEYDVGDILGRRELVVEPSWTAWRLAKRLDRPSITLLREITKAYAEGRPPRREVQDTSASTQAGLVEEDELELDFSWTAERLERRVRAASPFPGAFFFLGDALLTVVAARAVNHAPEGLAQGEVAVDAAGTAVVATGSGGLELLACRLAGDEDDQELALDRAGVAALVASLVT
jgi:methionyl-tRNA formyltransferase